LPFRVCSSFFNLLAISVWTFQVRERTSYRNELIRSIINYRDSVKVFKIWKLIQKTQITFSSMLLGWNRCRDSKEKEKKFVLLVLCIVIMHCYCDYCNKRIRCKSLPTFVNRKCNSYLMPKFVMVDLVFCFTMH
jgi:hypothetical protein